MSGNIAYLDSSAFLKLVLDEPESAALERFLESWEYWVSAWLVRAESIRVARRYGPMFATAIRRRLAALAFVALDVPLIDRSADLDPPAMRSLDAIHLAAALSLGPDLGVVVTYDDRMSEAAHGYGLTVACPT
jgi:predicted nucleic acid-binding protein